MTRFWMQISALLMLSLFSVTGVAAAGKGGNIRFEAHSHDFGAIYRGEVLSRKFTFTNTGSGPLQIVGIHAACGCTAVQTEQGRSYAPGESGSIEISLDTRDFAGPVVKTVTVMTSEKPLSDRNITVKAFVKTEIEADPPIVDFGEVVTGQIAEKRVSIRPLSGFRLEVAGLDYNKELMDAELKKEGTGWVAVVRLKPGLNPGFLKESITVRNNSRHLKELPVPVRAHVRGAVELSPDYLEFGSIPASETGRRSLTLKAQPGFNLSGTRAELNINGRKVTDPDALVKITSIAPERDKRLVSVELKNDGKTAGSVHGKLFFTTTAEGGREVSVDFYAFFR